MGYKSALTAIALLLAGNSAVHASSFTFYGPIYSNYKQKIDSGGGCISGSIGTTYPEINFNVIVLFASEKNTNSDFKRASFGFGIFRFDKRPTIVSEQLRAGVFTMCLKPGRYHLVGLNAINQYSAQRVHVPFDVEAGKHIYLGSFILHTATTKPQRCEREKSPMFFEIRDEHDRDIPLIMESKDSPGLPPALAIIDPTLGYPYFVSCSP